jgi:DNA invertase Pin-like site-specific DNA recombinase
VVTALVITIMAAVSQWEREAIGETTRDALHHKWRKGERVGNIRYGFRLCADCVHGESDPTEQEIVSRIHHLRTNGQTLRRVAELLNRAGYRTRRGSEWRMEQVNRVLKLSRSSV